MKRKTALVMISLLMLTALLTTPYFTPPATAPDPPSPSPEGVYHWKIMLAQKNTNAWIVGYLTVDGAKIPGTDFFLNCTCGLPEPQPLGQFVFWKINTTVIPNDIHYDKFIDYDKDGTPNLVETIDHPIPYFDPEYEYLTPEEPHTWYEHVEEGIGLFGPWMVVVEVREQPYDEERPFFEWQLMIKTHGVNASWFGWLTKDGVPLPGTDFNLVAEGDDLQCQVVRTPYCTVPNDIHWTLIVDDTPIVIDQNITQFPWTWTEITGPGKNVTLELTEVQMYRYIVMGGTAENAAQLDGFPEMVWNVPFASRPPSYTPLQEQRLNITFTQRDPITGIVKLGVPAESFVGIAHVFFGEPTVIYYYNVTTFMREQGSGWLFTGIGKDPILGDVDVITWNNDTGVYSNKTGKLINLQPGLQGLSGPDGIPGTGDPGDIFGDGAPDPPGSSVLYLPVLVHSEWSLKDLAKPDWHILYEAPYPQLYTTATTNDTVVEDQSLLNGLIASAEGEPWEFLAGLDHAGEPGYYPVPWKHPKSNAYVIYGNAYSGLNIPTSQGDLDLLWQVTFKLVREDCVIADIDCNELVDIFDIVKIGVAYGAKDETYGRPYADSNFDARADLKAEKGLIDIFDLVRCAIDYGKSLTPDCIITP